MGGSCLTYLRRTPPGTGNRNNTVLASCGPLGTVKGRLRLGGPVNRRVAYVSSNDKEAVESL